MQWLLLYNNSLTTGFLPWIYPLNPLDRRYQSTVYLYFITLVKMYHFISYIISRLGRAAFFSSTLIIQLRVGITRGKHFYHSIILLKEKVWAH